MALAPEVARKTATAGAIGVLRSQKPTHRRVFDQQRYFDSETARNVKRRAVYFLKSVVDHMNSRAVWGAKDGTEVQKRATP